MNVVDSDAMAMSPSAYPDWFRTLVAAAVIAGTIVVAVAFITWVAA
jgi:hypothetical protein